MAVQKEDFLINVIHNSIKAKHEQIFKKLNNIQTPEIIVTKDELNDKELIDKAIAELTTLADSVKTEEEKRNSEEEEKRKEAEEEDKRKAEELITKGQQVIDDETKKKQDQELNAQVEALIEQGKTIIAQSAEKKPEDENKIVIDNAINAAVDSLIAEGKKIIEGQVTPEQEESKTPDIETKSTDDNQLIENAKKILIEIVNNNMKNIMASNLVNTITNKSIDNLVVTNAYDALIAKAKELLEKSKQEEETEIEEPTEETKEPDCSNVIIELLKEKALNAILKQTITEPESKTKTETMNYDTITQLLIANGKLLLLSKPDEEKKECSDDILVELLKERALRAISEQMAKQPSTTVSGTDDAHLTTIAQLLIKHGELMLQQSTEPTSDTDGSKINTDTLVNLLEAIAKNKLLEEMLSAPKTSNTSTSTDVTTATSVSEVTTQNNVNKYINDIPAKLVQKVIS